TSGGDAHLVLRRALGSSRHWPWSSALDTRLLDGRRRRPAHLSAPRKKKAQSVPRRTVWPPPPSCNSTNQRLSQMRPVSSLSTGAHAHHALRTEIGPFTSAIGDNSASTTYAGRVLEFA